MIQINPIYHDIQLSFGVSDVKRTVIKQNSDNTHILRIKLYDKGNDEITINSGWDIIISAVKSDNKHILNSNNISVVNNSIQVTMTQQMLAAPGTEKCELIIQDGEQVLFSDTFLIYVEPNVQDGSFIDIESSDECNFIIDSLNKVKGYEKEALTAKDHIVTISNEVDGLKENIEETYDELENAVSRTNELIAENEVIKQNEANRVNAEEERKTQENTRINNENERISNENARKQSESNRINEEIIRIENENGRKSNENDRIEAENIRQKNESVRISQESKRQEDSSLAVYNAEKATNEATLATENCKEITSQAEDALQNQIQLNETLDIATQIKNDVTNMQSVVLDAKLQVEQDKAEIDDTIKNSLLASSEDILDAVKDYFTRAQALYDSMYLDCDGETPHLRVVTLIKIKGGTPQQRLIDGGISFDGGTPTSRLLGV